MRPPIQPIGPTDPSRFPTMSDRDYLTLLENIPAVAYRCLPVVTWPMIFISDEIANLCGWPAEDFIGLEPKRNYLSVIFPEDQQMVSDVIFEAVNERRPYSIEYRIVTNEGKLRWVFERGIAVHEENGNAAYLDGTIMDVTAKKSSEVELAKYRGHLEEMVAKRTSSLEAEVLAHELAERALAEKSHDLDELFNRSQDIIVVTGADGILRRVSPSMTQTIDLPMDEIIGHGAKEFIHPDDQKRTLQAVLETLKTGAAREISFRIRHRDGSYRDFEWMAYANGEALYAIGRDVSTRLAMEQALRDSEEQFRAIFDRSPISMALLRRPDMTCVNINDAMLHLLGRTREECLGQTPHDIGFFVTQKDIDEALEIVAAGTAKHEEAMEFRHADGTIKQVCLCSEPLTTSKGDYMLIFCTKAIRPAS